MTVQAREGIVYHYTSVDTLLKIVSSGEMWASSAQYLNDVMELNFFIKRVRNRIPNFIERNRIDKSHEFIFSGLLEAKELGFEQKPFLVSFSAQSDSLSQWRAYCQSGNGVSIGFRTDCLAKAVVDSCIPPQGFYSVETIPTVNFYPVQYPSETDNANIDGLIDACFALAKDKLGVVLGDAMRPEDQSRTFEFAIRSAASVFKHQSFSAEEEFRLVVSPPGEAKLLVNYRTLKQTLLPYIRLKLPRAKVNLPERVDTSDPLLPLSGRWQFVDEVVIGPSPNPELTRQALEGFFKREGMYVSIRSSDVPYRSWL